MGRCLLIVLFTFGIFEVSGFRASPASHGGLHVDVPPLKGTDTNTSPAPKSEHASHAADHESADHAAADRAKNVMLTTFLILTLGFLTNFVLDRWAPYLPFTCVIFAQGVLLSYFANGTETFGTLPYAKVVTGIEVWQGLDAHFGLFLFLPPLIFAEAMSMDMAMLRAVFWQAVILAIPGVLIGCGLTAVSTMALFPYGWGWDKAILFGSILSATDPVAVIAVFNSLGVAPKLKMLVSGESVFNDGTAVVLFEFCLMIVKHEADDMNLYKIGAFVFKKCIVGPAFGMALGYMAVCFIKWTSKGTFDSDSTVQLVVTLCCGYLAFILAELEFDSSGVLTVCASGVVLAAKASTKFVSHDSVHSVWHMIEFCGNTLVFMVAGMIFAHAFHPANARGFVVQTSDWILLFQNYLMAMVIRTVMLMLMYIPLYYSGPRVSFGEFVVMAWAGLRGAVGLLMAVMVSVDTSLKMPQVDFHVGGLATLTLLVNATLTPWVLKTVGMTKVSDQQLQMVSDVETKVAEEAAEHVYETLEDASLFKNVHASDVLNMLPRPGVTPVGYSPTEEAEIDDVKLEMLRRVMLRCLHSVYLEMTEERVLAKRSKISEVLAESTKHAMMFCDGPLCDLNYVKSELMLTAFIDEDSYNRRYWKILQHVRLYRNYRRYLQHKVTACIVFIHAHKESGEQVASFYCNGESGPSPALEALEQESAQQVAAVQKILDGQDPKLVDAIRRKMAVAKSLNFQLKTIQDLCHKGVLSEGDAARLTDKFMATLATISDDDKLLEWGQ